MEVLIQHWLTAVARTAELPSSDTLSVDAETDTMAAWDLVTMACGLSEEQLADAVAKHFRLKVARVEEADPQAHNLIPGKLARRLGVLPLDYSDRDLVVATADPVSLETERELGRISDRNVIFQIASPGAIQDTLEETYEGEDEEDYRLPDIGPGGRGISRILVVEDDEDTRLLLRSALESDGHEVIEADDGEKALELLESMGGFSLATVDLKLPGMGGLEVLERVRRMPRWQGLPVIVATGYDDPEVEILLFEEGADDFIVKPVDPRRFIVRVKAVLRRRGVLPA